MKLEKNKIVLDFDDTLVKSNEQIIRMLNQKYDLNKTIKDLTNWGYSSIYPAITSNEIAELFASEKFFEEVEWNDGAKLFLSNFKNTYIFIICTKGTKKNLYLKKLFLTTQFAQMNILDWEFIGLEIKDISNPFLDKSSIDFSDCLFCVDDNTSSLLSINTPKKILIKNYLDFPWNQTPINNQQVYVINNFYDLREMCIFDEKLRKEGIYIG